MHGRISPSMYTGSMVGAGAMPFALMPYAIANARPDENCAVDLNPALLTAVFGEPVEKIAAAIEYLCSPDPNSRSPDCEGRRLVHCGPGPFRYRVVNLEKYRDDQAREWRTEYWKQHKRWERAGRRGEFKFQPPLSTSCPQQSTSVHLAGAGAGAGAERKKAVGKSVDQTPNPEHAAFIEGWYQNFRAAHGFDYVFAGGRDGKAVKELLKTGILRIDLLEIAKQAWDRHKSDPGNFTFKKSTTIYDFCQYLNQIRTDLNYGNSSKAYAGNGKPNPRNAGQATDPIERGKQTAAIVARRQEERLRAMQDGMAT